MKDEIFALEQGAMERWRVGDPFGWSEISTEDVIYIDPGLTKPIQGLEEYREYLRGIKGKVHYQGSEFIDPKIVMVGEDAAVLSYNYCSSRDLPEGGVAKTPWNTTEIYFRRDSRWQIVHSHWSFVHHQVTRRVEIPLPILVKPVEFEGVLGELMILESAAMKRWRTGDPWGFLEIYAPGVTYFDTGTDQRVNGWEAMAARYREIEGKIFYDVMDFIEPTVRLLGDMAVLVYRFLSTRLNPDGSILSRTPWNCTEVYARSMQGWKIIHNHWSQINGERV